MKIKMDMVKSDTKRIAPCAKCSPATPVRHAWYSVRLVDSDRIVLGEGEHVCNQCGARNSVLLFRRMAGRCRSTRDNAGALAHIVPADSGDYGRALCGRRPGSRGNGWSVWEADQATCPECQAAITVQGVPGISCT